MAKKDVIFKTRSGEYEYKVTGSLTDLEDGLIEVRFRYNKKMVEEIKAFEGARWKPDAKCWTIKNTPRNHFQLEYLLGNDPYAWYDQPLKTVTTDRPAMSQQLQMASQGLTYHRVILGAEMGTGKTMAAILIMELSGYTDWWYVAPKSALRSVQLEFEKWGSKVKPKLLTYEALRKVMDNWPKDKKAPHGVIFDEASRAKNPTAQRSQACYELAMGIGLDWGNEGFVIEMSGTPAPKSPADWWMLCEIACPGFIREGTYEKFKRRLGVIVMKDSIDGGVYPQHVTWRDDESKCLICGMLVDDPMHDMTAFAAVSDTDPHHHYVKGVNEVSLLYERMKGLVGIWFKKDCLDLPEKRYEVIDCKPTSSILRAASIITAKSSTVVGAMTLLRELSDGFQYEEEQSGVVTCSLCKGTLEIDSPIHRDGTPNQYRGIKLDDIGDNDGTIIIQVTEENEERLQELYPVEMQDAIIGCSITPVIDEDEESAIKDLERAADEAYRVAGELRRSGITATQVKAGEYVSGKIPCPKCGGSGVTAAYKRTVVNVACPKDDVVRELLDRYDDVGRTVFYGGFSGSVDRLVNICRDAGWETIKVDGRGWSCSLNRFMSELDMLRRFQDGTSEEIPRLAFIGQPSAAGMGLTLTASPMICYYSNDFNAESRIQSEDRIHRAGMDVNRGATIYDICHLPTDYKVLNNLQKKRVLQAMSMGEILEALSHVDPSGARKL